jgi:hypothetical protein
MEIGPVDPVNERGLAFALIPLKTHSSGSMCWLPPCRWPEVWRGLPMKVGRRLPASMRACDVALVPAYCLGVNFFIARSVSSDT